MTNTDAASSPTYPPLSAAAREFLDAPRFAVLATLNPDGTPLQAVVWYLLDGGEIVFNSRVGRQWPVNIGRDKRVSITVADGYNYVDMRGSVEVDDDAETGHAVIARLSRRYRRSEAEAAAEIEVFRRQARVTFRLRPDRIFEHFR